MPRGGEEGIATRYRRNAARQRRLRLGPRRRISSYDGREETIEGDAGLAAGDPRPIRRRWRDYRTASGRSPVEEFIDGLSDSDAAAVLAGMEEVRDRGLRAARHLEGEVWEVRVDGDRVIYRILFAEEGSRGQILLALRGVQQEDSEDATVGHQAGDKASGGLAAARRPAAQGSGQGPAAQLSLA